MRSLTVLLLLATVSCSTVDTEVDWDPDADFANLKVYRWLEQRSPAPGTDSFLEQRVRDAVDHRLAERGYDIVKEGTVDFVVAWHAATRRELRVETIHHHFGYGAWPSYRWDGHGIGFHSTYRDEYDVGTLTLDVIDPTTQRLIWRGTASALVGGDRTPEEREERAQEMVDALLAKFPPD